MQFSNFTRTETGNIILFKNSSPLQGITALKYYTDNSSGPFQKKEFRWSFNGDYWSSWSALNQGNISGTSLGNNPYLFLEIRYTSAGGTVTSFILNYDGAAQASTASNCPPDSNYIPADKSISNDSYLASNQCSPGEGPIDAATLCGKSCDYYLWRPNHKGTQPISSITDLQKVLNNLSGSIQQTIDGGVNVGNGIGVLYDRIGRNLRFKSIDSSGGGVIITEGSDGTIYIAVDASFGGVQDPSILELFSDLNDISVYVDTQFIQINASLGRIDSSIDELYSLIDVSSFITGIDNIPGGDASIYKETTTGIAQLRPIEAGDNVTVTTVGNVIRISAIDTSVFVDASIVGVRNIGAGDGEIYSDVSDGVIGLRTLIGTGTTSVTTSGDEVIIHTTDPSIEDSSIKNIINVGTGQGEIFAEIDASGVAELRKIKGSGAISVTTSGDDIILFSDASITVDPCTWSDNDQISADVGGLKSGDVVPFGSNSIEILEDILYEYFPPNFNLTIDPCPGPTSATGYYEKWVESPISNGLYFTYVFDTSNYVKNSIQDVSTYENGDFLEKINWNNAKSGSRLIYISDPVLGVSWDDLVYSLEVGHAAGGNAMPTYDISTALIWTDPYFYGVVPDSVNYSNITNADILNYCASTKVIVPEQTNQITYNVSANYVKLKFVYAYPAAYSDLKSIFDVKNDFNVTSSFDSSIVNVKMSGMSGPGPYVPYKVYIKSHWISFTPDVSIFKLIFNI